MSESKDNLLHEIILYHEFVLSRPADSLIKLNIIRGIAPIKKTLTILYDIKEVMLNGNYDEALIILETKLGDINSIAEPLISYIQYFIDNPNVSYSTPDYNIKDISQNNSINNDQNLILQKLELFISNSDSKNEKYSQVITEMLKNGVDLQTDVIDSLNKIPGLTQEAVVKHFIDHKTLVSTALSNISTQVEYNQRKLLTDLVAAEVKIIASEVNKFIIHYTGLLEKLDKQAVTSLDKLTAHCKATISDRDNKVMYNFNAVTKKIVIFSLISALLTAPILGFTTGYITSKINKITFFNALNDIVNNKKSK